VSDATEEPASLDAVLDGAARLQELVPGAVRVGGSAAVLTTLEALDDWSTARLAGGKLILGELGGIETGVRQMVRRRPLEVEEVPVGSRMLRVPTIEEILRIKAWLVVTRNRTRDYVDAAALSDRFGTVPAGHLLARMDEFYAEVNLRPEAVATQIARQFADPAPKDPSVTLGLASYKRLDPRWHDWAAVVSTLREVAVAMVGGGEPEGER
jgi:hypothetical protein